jgi:PAS domain S-box-containing protein
MLINDSNIHPSIPLIEYISTLPVMPTKLKILHLEDFATDAELISNVLKKEQLEFEILVVDTKEKFIDALQDFSPDIILADHSLPSFDSYDALAILVETGICVPFILVTAAMSDEFAVDIIKKGADDYIIKDRLKRLPVAIYNSLEKFRLEKERKAFIDKLVEKEKRYHALVENSADAVFILNAKGKITYVSSSARQVLGYSEEEVMEMDWFTIAHFDDVAEMADVMQQALNTPGTPAKGHLSRWLHKNGSWPWIEATVTNMLADPAINGIVANFRDVTERKIAEKKIVHLNRLYAFLSQINQTIVHSPDQETVFKQACRIACDTGKFRVAWIGVFDEKNQTISLVEGCGLKPNHLTELSKVFYERGGPQDTVLSTGNYYICDNIKNNREINKWKTFAAGNRFGSFIILPLKKSGRIFGTLNLYACDSEFFNSEEIELLTEATKDISFALDVFEKEKLKLQADEKVKHRELRLNQAQAIAHLGSWEVDFVSGILTWSEEALRIHGLPQQEVEQTYDSWLSFIHPDDLDRVLQVSKEARLAVSNYSFYHRIIRKDGIVRSVFSEAHFEFDSTGKLKGLYGVTHDITEMKKAEDALRVSELNLRTIFNSTSEAFMLCDNNGIVKTFNNKLKDQTFLNSEKEIKIGDSMFDFVAETRKHNFGDAFIKALAGESLQYDYPSKRKSGKTDWFSFTVNPVYNSEKIEGISITSRDITSRKKDEQKMIATSKELKRAVTDLKQIMDSSLDVICTINGDGFFVSVSAASKIVWGFAPEELVGKPFIDFVVKEDINSTVEAAEDIVNGRLVPIFENRYLHKNGRVVPILWSVNWDEKNRLMFALPKI